MDKVGIGIGIFLIVLPLLLSPFLLRYRGVLRLFGAILAGSSIALGVLKILFYAGRIDQGPAYRTIDYSLSALFFVVLLLGLRTANVDAKNTSRV